MLYKECEGKVKMVQEQWLQLKMKFLLSYNIKIAISCGQLTFGAGIKNLAEGSLLVGFF